MTSRDFVFWLQGFFETKPDTQAEYLSRRQVDKIKKHLQMVFQAEYHSGTLIEPGMGIEFCHWLSDTIRTFDQEDGLSEAETKMVRDRLFDLFEHVIDPPSSTTDNPDQEWGDMLAMC